MEDDDLKTRHSLVGRLKDWDDQYSWQIFFDTYWKLIYGTAVRAGLTDSEAEDVVQETVLSVAKKMPSFVYNPAVCSFKGWLLHVTRLRIADQFRKRGAAVLQPLEYSDSGSTAIAEQLPDPAGLSLDAIWDEEWEKNLMDAAMERVKRKIKPLHYQIFHMSLVKRIEMRKIGSLLGVTTGQVYLTRHRVARLIKQEIARLRAQFER